MATNLRDLHKAVRRGRVVRSELEDKGIFVEIPTFDIFFERELKKILNVPSYMTIICHDWDELVTKCGDPGDADFLSKEVFVAFVETNNWLRSLEYYINDSFEETVCDAFCLMWSYLYDRFGESAMVVIGDLRDDEAAQFYDDEISES